MQKNFLKYSYLFLFFPVLLLTVVINNNTSKTFAPERIIFLYLLFYSLAFFISNKFFKSIYVRFVFICSLIFTFLEIGYVLLYKERITSSTAFILLETNSAEIKEYLNEYVDLRIILWLLALLIPSYFILVGVNRLINHYTFKEIIVLIKSDIKKVIKGRLIQFIRKWLIFATGNKLKKTVFGLIMLIAAIFVYAKENHHNYFVGFQLYLGYENYIDEVKKYKTFLNNELNNEVLLSVKNNNPDKIKETCVLIIGESTTSNHLGIYDYYRNTTPQLNKIKNELVIFNNVISPHTHTIPSLEKVLTFGNYENLEAKFNGSIVQLMKKAGYKTFWISNQVPIGVNETMASMIAKASDYTHFTNLGGEKELKSLDERVFPYLENVLKDNSNKKFIVVHLLGTHSNYKNRYPKEYDYFIDVPLTPFPSEKAHLVINEYDNAILYNDFIIAKIFNTIKQYTSEREKTFAIYFSDHGEDVFETVDFHGHSESIGSQPMFQIPFIYWNNNEDEVKKFNGYVNRKYMIDNLIYSIADLSNITFKGMKSNKSIFNDTLQERIRIVKKHTNYDDNLNWNN